MIINRVQDIRDGDVVIVKENSGDGITVGKRYMISETTGYSFTIYNDYGRKIVVDISMFSMKGMDIVRGLSDNLK